MKYITWEEIERVNTGKLKFDTTTGQPKEDAASGFKSEVKKKSVPEK